MKLLGRGVGACTVIQIVSGRLRARPKEANLVAVSPRPWRRMRMFGTFPSVVGVGGGVVSCEPG